MTNVRRAAVIVGLLAPALLAYQCGRTAGHAARDADAYRMVRDTIVRTERIVELRIQHDTVRVRETAAIAASARARFDSAATVVETAADSLPALPASLVLPAISTCRDALAADSTHVAELRATVADALEAQALANRHAALADAHADSVEHQAADDQRAARRRGWKEAGIVAAMFAGVISLFR